MVIVHQGHSISGKPGTVSVQQCRRCACQSSAEVSDQEACSLYIWYADQADDKADVVLLNAYISWPYHKGARGKAQGERVAGQKALFVRATQFPAEKSMI
ncbi:MAG: hypothetical protein A2512_03425 [Deltaproteobacteria bacterium RIFOXYD12_FULL_56_24]|nr:MAG: hypothetical protein A2512_03425 [Deltaproteobacteria bacterium RIFOXYD12_FULL_56_24]